MKENNPFTLTFGRQPLKYISRDAHTNNIITSFCSDPPICQTWLISGIRGCGKTVLMTSVAKGLAEKKDWVVVDLNSARNLLDDLAMRLSDICKKFPDLAEAGFDISVAGFGIGIGSSKSDRDSISRIESMLDGLVKHNRKLLITIDEVTNNANMREFASQFQIFIREEFPVFLIMTGLYDNIYAIQNDPALTFLLRSPKIFLEPLSIRQITDEYENIFGIDRSGARELALTTKGYAFAFQALGMLYYEYRDSCSMEMILQKLDNILDDYVYKKIWQGLSSQDKAVVLAMSKNSKMKVKDIYTAVSMTPATFSKYRERLLNKGVLLSSQRGELELALPRFGRIVSEYAEWEI